jgi:hypothetical protein
MTAVGTGIAARASVGGAIKLARLLEMPESETEARVRRLEADPLFPLLLNERALRIEPYAARLAARRPEGRSLSISSGASLFDGQDEMIELIRRVGQERFEEFFLGDAHLPDGQRAAACDISVPDARSLREFVDRVYIRAEFEAPTTSGAPSPVFSLVAGVELDGGKPILAFFHRDIWKGRYRLDGGRLADLRQSLPFAQARRLDRLVCQLELLDRRKSTLYRVMEVLLDYQREFLVSGDPSTRRPLMQMAIARRLDILPSVLSRLVSNKSIRLPGGLEAPLKELIPSAKRLLLGRVDELAASHPSFSDERLRAELAKRFGARLSRRSVAQYRKELRLGGTHDRRAIKARPASPGTITMPLSLS